MPPAPEKDTHGIPLSKYPPVSLERPLKLFGETFSVFISTTLTLSPHTVLQSAYGASGLQIARMQKERVDRTLNALWRANTGRNKPSLTTRKLIKQTFGAFVPSEDLDDALQGKEQTAPRPWQGDWEMVQKVLGEPYKGVLSELVARLARLDRLAFSAGQLAKQGLEEDAEALLAPYIGSSIERWREYNPNLGLLVALLVDISLQTLAWLEWRAMQPYPVDGASAPGSLLGGLLAPGKKPIGHWLVRMRKSAGCTNLRAFSGVMAAKDIRWHSCRLSHDLLKKWSSGQQLMPTKGGESVIKAVSAHVDEKRQRNWFAAARFLSFLCDLVIAGSRGMPPSWAAAQDQVRMCFGKLSELEADRQTAR